MKKKKKKREKLNPKDSWGSFVELAELSNEEFEDALANCFTTTSLLSEQSLSGFDNKHCYSCRRDTEDLQ